MDSEWERERERGKKRKRKMSEKIIYIQNVNRKVKK